MRATEVFVEQVLIGFLVLIALALAFSREFQELEPLFVGETASDIASGFGLIGLAYLVGIPADRIIDTILGGTEQRMRLWNALKRKPAGNGAPDWFPEGQWRLSVLRFGGGPLAYDNYLRSRIRLARAIAVLGPAITLAGMLVAARSALVVDSEGPKLWTRTEQWLAGGLAAIYVGALLLGLLRESRCCRLPRTGEKNGYQDWQSWRFLAEPVLVCVAAIVALGICIGVWSRGAPVVITVALAGGAVSAAAAWSWLRITRTYFAFLKNFIDTTPPQ